MVIISWPAGETFVADWWNTFCQLLLHPWQIQWWYYCDQINDKLCPVSNSIVTSSERKNLKHILSNPSSVVILLWQTGETSLASCCFTRDKFSGDTIVTKSVINYVHLVSLLWQVQWWKIRNIYFLIQVQWWYCCGKLVWLFGDPTGASGEEVIPQWSVADTSATNR